MLNHQFRRYSTDHYYASSILDHLQDGVTEGNIDERARMLAGKTRRLAGSDAALFAFLGITALTAPLDEHPEPLLLFAHHFARMLSKARAWGLPTSVQLDWLGSMRGELSERLRGQILAGAGDRCPQRGRWVRHHHGDSESRERPEVPVQVLDGLGRWAFVRNIDDGLWAELTARTLDATGGRINLAVSVTDRAAGIAASSTSRGILLVLLDNGEPWERRHAAGKALEVLCATRGPMDESFQRLRTRLVDLGYHQAGDITPPDGTD